VTTAFETWTQEWARRVWNSDDLDEGRRAISEMLAPECLLAGLGGDVKPIYGPEAYLPFWEQLRGAFGELRCTVPSVSPAEDGLSGEVEFEIQAVHRGDFLGKAATGNSIRVRGKTVIRLNQAGQAIETENDWDMEGLLAQIDHSLASVQAAMDGTRES
tara:strand:+ start:631 stop:1107 length:477 start_codon:yes stop_codon:yes gene_type:complete